MLLLRETFNWGLSSLILQIYTNIVSPVTLLYCELNADTFGSSECALVTLMDGNGRRLIIQGMLGVDAIGGSLLQSLCLWLLTGQLSVPVRVH